MVNEFDVNLSAFKQKYPGDTHVLLFGVEGIPDNSSGVVDLVDDRGRLFIETGNGFKNVVLGPEDENTRFVRDCVNYNNIVSKSFVALDGAEIDYDLPGVKGCVEVTDFLISMIPELAYCLSLDNDDWVDARASWNMKTGEVTLLLFNDAAITDADYVEKELVLTGKDKDWVVNALNKEFVEKYGMPAKAAFEYVKKEDVVAEYLNNYPLSPVAVVNDTSYLNRVNVCCKLFDLDATKKIVTNLAMQTEVHPVSKDMEVFDLELTEDGKYLSFAASPRGEPWTFDGLFRVSDAKKGADMKLVSVIGHGIDEGNPLIKKNWNEIETFVRKYVEFKGLDSKVASVDAVLAKAEKKSSRYSSGKENVNKEDFVKE